jgi:hypothetical protein
MPAGELGGNHMHVRKEAFIGIGEGLEIHWLGKDGATHKSPMIPHAIKNTTDSPAVILEYADLPQEQSPVERVEVIPVGGGVYYGKFS